MDWYSLEVFDNMKRIIAKETILFPPKIDELFDTHIVDESDRQLGGLISQDGKPFAFNSRKPKGVTKKLQCRWTKMV